VLRRVIRRAAACLRVEPRRLSLGLTVAALGLLLWGRLLLKEVPKTATADPKAPAAAVAGGAQPRAGAQSIQPAPGPDKPGGVRKVGDPAGG